MFSVLGREADCEQLVYTESFSGTRENICAAHRGLSYCFLNGIQMIQHVREMAMKTLESLNTETILNALFGLCA